MRTRMKLTKKQQQTSLILGIAALGTMAVLAVSPLGNFFMSNLFGSNAPVDDAGLYMPYSTTVGTSTVMRAGTGVHLGSNDTRYGTGSTVHLRAQVTLVPRSLGDNSISGVVTYDPTKLSMSANSILLSGSGFTIDPAITRVVRNADNSEAGQFYFSVDRNTGNFIKPYHQFMTLEVQPLVTQPSYTLTLDSFRYLDTNHIATADGDSLYTETSTSGVRHVPLVITPGTNYIMERVWIDGNERHVEETLYNENNVRLSTTERVYDNTDGHLMHETIIEYGPDGTTPIREIERDYYEDGITVRHETETVHNPDGTNTITERDYDRDGNLINETTRTEGTPIQTNRPPVVTLGAADGLTSNGVTLHWTGSNQDSGETFTYTYCISTSSGTLLQNCDTPTTANTATRSNLAASTAYYWTVVVSDGTFNNIGATNGPLTFTTLAASTTGSTPAGTSGGPSGGGGGGSFTPPSPNGSGGGFSEFDGEFVLPSGDDNRSLIVYGPLNFKNSDGYVRLPIHHVDKTTGFEADYLKGTRVTNADGTGFTGIYNPLIRYPLSQLHEPMRGLLPTDMTLAYEYFMQYGNLHELFNPAVTIKGFIGDLNVPKDEIIIMGWDFQQQKWVQIGDGNNIVDGRLTINISKSMVIGIFKKTAVTQASTTLDICDDAKNPNRTPFRDANSHWATAYICKLYNLKAISGYTDGPFKGLFRPDNSINRAELLKIIMAAEGIQVNTSVITPNFPDVPSYEWFAPYVARAKELHLVDGYPDGTFQPFRQVNRSEALKIILNASKKIDDKELADKINTYKTNPPARSLFNDIQPRDWFAPYIDLAAAKGIISGKSAGIFRAGDDMTRAEVSKVVQLTITLP